MATVAQLIDEKLHEATPEQEWQRFDLAAHRYLGISGKEFLDRWQRQQYPDPDTHPGVLKVAFLIPPGQR